MYPRERDSQRAQTKCHVREERDTVMENTLLYTIH